MTDIDTTNEPCQSIMMNVYGAHAEVLALPIDVGIPESLQC